MFGFYQNEKIKRSADRARMLLSATYVLRVLVLKHVVRRIRPGFDSIGSIDADTSTSSFVIVGF